MHIGENEASEFEQFSQAINAVERAFDFVVIDTPGTDNYLMRLAHSMADTLITPINDSFVDFDVLGTVDPATYWVTGESHYAKMVREARRHRRQIDGASTDWIVVRNRLSLLSSRNKQLIAEGLNTLASTVGFRAVDGFAERVVYRELFPRGLTALDDLNSRDARHAAEHGACHRARGGDEPAAPSQAAARRARPPPRRRPRRMVRAGRQAARDARHRRGLVLLSQKVAVRSCGNQLLVEIHVSMEAVMDHRRETTSESRFAAYVEGLVSVIGHADRAAPLHDYCVGLMLPCERKSVEPMAARTAPARTSAQHQIAAAFCRGSGVVGREGVGQGARAGVAGD